MHPHYSDRAQLHTEFCQSAFATGIDINVAYGPAPPTDAAVDPLGATTYAKERYPALLQREYFSFMIRVSFSTSYLSHKRFCDTLEQAARRKPAYGQDPVFVFTRATLQGNAIEPGQCHAIAKRMEELAQGELARPALVLASRLRAAAAGETTFSFC